MRLRVGWLHEIARQVVVDVGRAGRDRMTPRRHLDRRDPMLRQYAACGCHADIGQHENVELIVSHRPDRLQKSLLTEYRATELSQRSKSLRDFVQVSIECVEEERIVVVW